MVAAWISDFGVHDQAAAVTFDVLWPDGRRYQYVVTRDAIQARDLATQASRQIGRSRVAMVQLVEGAGSVTVLCSLRRSSLRRCWERWTAWRAGAGTRPFDDQALGTAVGRIDAQQLGRQLEQLGYPVRRTTWPEALTRPA